MVTLRMPTINEYKDGSGFYILARPSQVGNITYQVSAVAERILKKLGYEDGDEVDWRTVKALKVTDLVYTGEQGVSGPASVDFSAEIEDAMDNLTEQEAEELLDEMRERASLSNAQLTDVEDILGVTVGTKFEQLEANIEQALSQAGQHGDLSSLALSDSEFIVDVSDLRDSTENGLCNISLTGTLDGSFDNEPYQHGIFVCQEHGVEGWRCRSDFADSWDFKTEMYRQMAVFLPTILDELEAVGIDIGTPEKTPPPEIGIWEFE